MKKFYLKALVTAALGLGSSSAWAVAGEETTVVNIPFNTSAAAIKNGDTYTGTVGSMTFSQPSGNAFYQTGSYLRVGTGTGTVEIAKEDRAGYAHKAEGKNYDVVEISFSMAFGNTGGSNYSGFEILDENDEVIVTLMSSKWAGVSSTANTFGLALGTDITSQSGNDTNWNQKTDFTLLFNYQTGLITCKTNQNSTGKTISMPSGNPVVAKFVLRSGEARGAGDTRQPFFSGLLIKNTEGDYTASVANYTVNWKLAGEDTPVRSEIRSGNVNDDIELLDSDDDSFWVSTQKYFYVSNDLTDQVVLEDGSSVVNITVREAESWSYTVNAVDGSDNILKQLNTGSVTEGESVFVVYPRNVLSGTTLYCSGTGGFTYSTTVTPDADSYVKKIVYNTGAPISNVVYYTEAEDVTGASVGTNDARASMGKMGHTGGADTYLDVTTVASGNYILYMRGQNGNSAARAFSFKVGETEVFNGSFANGTNTDLNSAEFVVPASSTLSFASEGSGQSGIDYFYLVRTGDAAVSATIGATGYTTFASTYALDLDHLPTGVTAYYVQSTGVKGDYVSLSDAKGTVEAGTGLILKATEAGTYSIPVAASGSALSGNKLVGCTTSTEVGTNASKYVLAANGGVAEFQNLSGNAANVPAGKAYLDLSDMAAKARLIIALDGEANDIDEVEIDEEADDAPLYNVAGQIVDDEYKGIVIKNGKKYLNK